MSPRARRFFGCILPLAIVLFGCGSMLMMGYASQILVSLEDIQDAAMEPLLSKEDTVVTFNSAYWAASPSRGNVVYLRHDKQRYLRHIAGEPQETIEILDGKLYIDGKVCHAGSSVKEEACRSPLELADIPGDQFENMGPIELGEDEYFVLAQNIEGPDSRHWGLISRTDILGQGFFVLGESPLDVAQWEPIETPAAP